MIALAIGAMAARAVLSKERRGGGRLPARRLSTRRLRDGGACSLFADTLRGDIHNVLLAVHVEQHRGVRRVEIGNLRRLILILCARKHRRQKYHRGEEGYSEAIVCSHTR